MMSVPEAGGVRGKLHLGSENPTHTLVTLNRLLKHRWGLNTTHLLWSYRNRGLGDQPACRAPPPWERKAVLTAGSDRTGKGHTDGLPIALG